MHRCDVNRAQTRGSAAVASLMLALVLFGFTAAFVSYSITDTRAVSGEVGQVNAFYLAEAGLEAAKKEMITGVEASESGLGNVAASWSVGSYTVASSDLGGGYHELLSAGEASQDRVVLRQVLEEVPNPAFPIGAVSVVGATDKTKLHFKNDTGMVIAGDDSPGIVFTDPGTYAEVMEDVTAALETGKINGSDISGAESTTVTLGGGSTTDVSVVQRDLIEGGLTDLTDLYLELVSEIGSRLPTATAADFSWSNPSGVDGFVAGSAGAPVLWNAGANLTLNRNDTLTGHGTLIISDQFKVDPGATIDWTGDIVVFGDDTHRPRVTVEGNLNLDGNLIILGAGDETAELWFKSGSIANIDGSVFMGTHYDEDEARRTRLAVDGEINVNGMFSAFGSMIDISFFTGSSFDLNGMMQLGFVDSPTNTTLKMHFNGDMDIQKDTTAMISGLKKMQRMARAYDIASLETVISYAVTNHSWTQVPHYAQGD